MTEKEYDLSLVYSLQGTSWSLSLYCPGVNADSGLPEDSLSTPSVGAAGFGPGCLLDLGLGGPGPPSHQLQRHEPHLTRSVCSFGRLVNQSIKQTSGDRSGSRWFG